MEPNNMKEQQKLNKRQIEVQILEVELVNDIPNPLMIQLNFQHIKYLTQPKKVEEDKCLKINESYVFDTYLPLNDNVLNIKLKSKQIIDVTLGTEDLNLIIAKFPLNDVIPIHHKKNRNNIVGRINLKIRILPPNKQDSLMNEINPMQKQKRDFKSILLCGLEPLIWSAVVENYPDIVKNNSTPMKAEGLNIDDYRSKLYIFGDDGNPTIIEFDYITEKFRTLSTPYNLHLFGYSMFAGLPNGKIIITGGINKNLNIIVSTCFLYDPITGKAKILKDMYQPRYTHTMTYMNGEIYVMGGRYYGKDKEGVLKHTEKYNLATNKWIVLADMNEKRCTAAACAHNGCIYIFGGYHGQGRLKSIEKYNPIENKWEVVSLQMLVPIEAGFCRYLGDGKVVYIAGKDDSKNNNDVTIYDLINNTATPMSKLNNGRVLPRHGYYKGVTYVFGGSGFTWEKASITDWKWQTGGDYSHISTSEMKLFGSATTQDFLTETRDAQLNQKNHFYIIGNQAHPFISYYSTLTNEWKQIKPPVGMKLFNKSGAIALPNGYILVAGGYETNEDKTSITLQKKCYIYDCYKETYLHIAQMHTAKHSFSMVEVDGFAYSIGGFDANGLALSLCERYNFRANRWETIDYLAQRRALASLYVNYNKNMIYAFGGYNGYEIYDTIECYSIKNDHWKFISQSIGMLAKTIAILPIENTNEILLLGTRGEGECIFDTNTNQIKSNICDSILQEKLSNLVINDDNNINDNNNNNNTNIDGNNINNNAPAIKFTKYFYSMNKMYIFGGEDYISKATKYDNLYLPNTINNSANWENIKSYNMIIKDSLDDLASASIYLDNTDKNEYKPLGLIDELGLGYEGEKENELFIFINENNKQQIIKYNLKYEYFEDVNLPKNIQINKYGSATSLPDGRIMYAGGYNIQKNPQNNLTEAFVFSDVFYYSSFNNEIKPLPSMHKCRYQHSIVYHKGYVYAIGGKQYFKSDNLGYLNHCERFSIKENEWEEVAHLNHPRANFASCSIGQWIYVIGGRNETEVLNKIERYTQTSGWELIELVLPVNLEGSIGVPIAYNEILILGGTSSSGTSVHTTYSFNIYLKTITQMNSLMHNRSNSKIVTNGNNIYAIGGSGAMSTEKMNLSEKSWSLMSSYEHFNFSDIKSASFAVSKLDIDSQAVYEIGENPNFNKLYIFGTENVPKILRLNLDTITWEILPVPQGLKLWDYSLAITLPSGKIFLAGGINNSLNEIKNTAFMLDFSPNAENQLEVLPLMNHARYTHTCSYLNNYIYLLGGRYYGTGINGVLAHCERFHIPTQTWQAIAPMNSKRCTAISTTFNNKIYIFGGYRGDGRVKTIERYHEIQNSWENIPLLLAYPIEAESFIHLSNKEIVFLGGKDDFAEQTYVTLYNLERNIVKHEPNMLAKRILCKSAKYRGEVFIVGGNSGFTCERAMIGEWNWKNFETYSSVIDNNLTKASSAQSYQLPQKEKKTTKEDEI